ncbi:DUF664 domain-containing protein [Nakamurella sp. YIM 132087]|uniref:DUF664 domain-containing protein n=1 Tax=Nakamurella alba TaxID=2665158 RepID=A0A7K1FFR8_9ACTN|nr:DinB family protein [Nakamurella alba]MTD12910.1 DUF664 domain-containing protein [Nakamurella alba]
MDAVETLDTRIDEPGRRPGEAGMLLFALRRSRAQFAWKVGGLDAEQLARPMPPSSMTIGGLVKHLALVEEQKIALALTGRPPAPPWDTHEPDTEWTSAAADTPEQLYGLWRATVARAEAALAGLTDADLDRPVAVWPWEGEPPNVRLLLVDLHDEYARHVGHADLFRERIDGLTGEDPPQPE